MADENRAYIGDGVYAEFQGFQIRLYSSDGIRETNEVFLEITALKELIAFAKRHGATI